MEVYCVYNDTGTTSRSRIVISEPIECLRDKKNTSRQERCPRPPGGFSRCHIRSSTTLDKHNEQWKNETVAKQIAVSKTSISTWRKDAKFLMAQDLSLRSSEQVQIRIRTLTDVEKILLHYAREQMRFINIETLFRQTMVPQKALEVREKLVQDLDDLLEEDMSDARWQRLSEQRIIYEEFQASDRWIVAFL